MPVAASKPNRTCTSGLVESDGLRRAVGHLELLAFPSPVGPR